MNKLMELRAKREELYFRLEAIEKLMRAATILDVFDLVALMSIRWNEVYNEWDNLLLEIAALVKSTSTNIL